MCEHCLVSNHSRVSKQNQKMTLSACRWQWHWAAGTGSGGGGGTRYRLTAQTQRVTLAIHRETNVEKNVECIMATANVMSFYTGTCSNISIIRH